ncbi:LysR family transcriptional regulator [Pigmentiphaga daeguensis]|uniref:LysR family transcriptional regulator n=1 Tax=Pigmentiphaga daeguensis TaxID=414049 RepID=A0ABN1CES6_9BURK
MDLRQLKYLVRIVECGSFSAAARQLGMVQPSLSKQIALLESELHAQLLTRNARGVRLTPAGIRVLNHAQAMLRQERELLSAARELPSIPAGIVALGVLPSLAQSLGVPLVAHILKKWPQVQFQVVEAPTASILEGVHRGNLDLGLITADTPPADTRSIRLRAERFFFVSCSTENDSDISLAALAGQALALPVKGNAIRDQIDRSFNTIGHQAKVVAEFESVISLLVAASSGAISTIVPACALGIHGGLGAAHARRIVKPALSRTLWLCASSILPMSAAAAALFDEVPRVARARSAR